jgi:hypothetical protein
MGYLGDHCGVEGVLVAALLPEQEGVLLAEGDFLDHCGLLLVVEVLDHFPEQHLAEQMIINYIYQA